MEKIRKAAGYLLTRFEKIPETVIVLGSGLGGFADCLENKTAVSYSEIPGFPVSTAPGHAGKMIYGESDGKAVLCDSKCVLCGYCSAVCPLFALMVL